MKSEPTDYSIDDLEQDGFIDWYGIRNYQARNFMRDQMSIDDLAFFFIIQIVRSLGLLAL